MKRIFFLFFIALSTAASAQKGMQGVGGGLGMVTGDFMNWGYNFKYQHFISDHVLLEPQFTYFPDAKRSLGSDNGMQGDISLDMLLSLNVNYVFRSHEYKFRPYVGIGGGGVHYYYYKSSGDWGHSDKRPAVTLGAGFLLRIVHNFSAYAEAKYLLHTSGPGPEAGLANLGFFYNF